MIIGPALPNIPWEERPEGCSDVVWRSGRNPIIPRDLIPCSNSIFNSAVVPFGDGFAGVFRVDNKRREMRVHAGFSRDAIAWQLDEEPIEFITDVPEFRPAEYHYDPRVCWIEDRYYVTWCNGYRGPTIGVGYIDTHLDCSGFCIKHRINKCNGPFESFTRIGLGFNLDLLAVS